MIGRRLISQGAVGIDAWLHFEQARLIVGHNEVHRLSRFAAASWRRKACNPEVVDPGVLRRAAGAPGKGEHIERKTRVTWYLGGGGVGVVIKGREPTGRDFHGRIHERVLL